MADTRALIRQPSMARHHGRAWTREPDASPRVPPYPARVLKGSAPLFRSREFDLVAELDGAVGTDPEVDGEAREMEFFLP